MVTGEVNVDYENGQSESGVAPQRVRFSIDVPLPNVARGVARVDLAGEEPISCQTSQREQCCVKDAIPM